MQQDYRDELATPACKAQVHKLSERASQDVRFDEPLADACYEDRNKLCDGVQPVRNPARPLAEVYCSVHSASSLLRQCSCIPVPESAQLSFLQQFVWDVS